MTKILLIGCGNMGHALLSAWQAMPTPPQVSIVDPTEALRDRAAKTGARTFASAAEVPRDLEPDLVILAVKPQVIGKVLPDYAHLDACFLSIAAGTTLASLQRGLDDKAIIRCMPNTPAAIGKGVFGIFANARVTPAQNRMVRDVLEPCGIVLEVGSDEDIDRITAISGSGPAYLFHFIEALAQAGRRIGLTDDVALAAARGTVFGAASLAEGTDEDAGQLRRNVTSPNGTTAAALEVLVGTDRMADLLTEAAEAAFGRAKALAATE